MLVLSDCMRDLAGRIHLSPDANKFLTEVIGGYHTESRGDIIIKASSRFKLYFKIKLLGWGKKKEKIYCHWSPKKIRELLGQAKNSARSSGSFCAILFLNEIYVCTYFDVPLSAKWLAAIKSHFRFQSSIRRNVEDNMRLLKLQFFFFLCVLLMWAFLVSEIFSSNKQ